MYCDLGPEYERGRTLYLKKHNLKHQVGSLNEKISFKCKERAIFEDAECYEAACNVAEDIDLIKRERRAIESHMRSLDKQCDTCNELGYEHDGACQVSHNQNTSKNKSCDPCRNNFIDASSYKCCNFVESRSCRNHKYCGCNKCNVAKRSCSSCS
jgi:hypothetical protein